MSNVRQLRTIHPERREQLKVFCADQAGHFMRLACRPDGAVAALSVVITGDGQAVAKMAAMEPEHAMVMLEELDRLRVKLTAYVVEQAPELLQDGSAPVKQAEVIPVRRPA